MDDELSDEELEKLWNCPFPPPTKCDFYGCNEPIDEEVYGDCKTGMKFCKRHDVELTLIVNSEQFSPAKLLNFWVRAKGGAKNAAQSM